MAVFNPRTHRGNGCYKVNGVSYQDWDGYHDRSTRSRLKKLDQQELDEYYTDGEEPGVPGAFGEGGRRPRRERRKYTYRERRERQQKVFKEWLANWKRHNAPLA